MIGALMFATYANPMRVCDSADFDGSNDQLATIGGGFAGRVNSKSGTFSCWLRFDGGTGQQGIYLSQNGLEAYRNTSSGAVSITGKNSSGTIILSLPTSSTFSAGASWFHFLASWDLAIGAGTFYVNDVADIGSTTLTNDTINYNDDPASVGIGGRPVFGDRRFNGCMAELYFNQGVYLDFALVANRRKFISASGKPVHVGSDGSLPTGAAPLVYLHLDDGESVSNFATNRGTAGNFTANSGTLDTGSNSPSD